MSDPNYIPVGSSTEEEMEEENDIYIVSTIRKVTKRYDIIADSIYLFYESCPKDLAAM